MTPCHFPQENSTFGPPKELDASQCMAIPGHIGQIRSGNLDGSVIVVVAWMPNEADKARIMDGKPVFLTSIGALCPHRLSTTFEEAMLG